MRLLVTRPEGQSGSICAQLEQLGHEVILQPALRIVPEAENQHMRNCIAALDEYYAVVFVSPNAARLAMEKMEAWWPQWPVGVHWVAVGEATRAVLAEYGLQALSPVGSEDSEGLLELDLFTHLSEQKLLLCKGEGGRTLLQQEWQKRGAEVDLLSLYRRQCNASFCWPEQAVDAVFVTSVQSWQCIASAFVRAMSSQSVPCLLVGSQRIAETIQRECREKGWPEPELHIARSPADHNMLALLDGL